MNLPVDPSLALPFPTPDEMAQHETFMRVALREAARGEEKGDIPVGAVIVHQGKIIGKAHNQRELLQDPTAHAEILAITQAASALGSWRLLDTVLYVTLEPCAMCAGAIVLARIPLLVIGARDPKTGACGSLFNIVQDDRLNHRVKLVPEVLQAECSEMLSAFFRAKRKPGAGPALPGTRPVPPLPL